MTRNYTFCFMLTVHFIYSVENLIMSFQFVKYFVSWNLSLCFFFLSLAQVSDKGGAYSRGYKEAAARGRWDATEVGGRKEKTVWVFQRGFWGIWWCTKNGKRSRSRQRCHKVTLITGCLSASIFKVKGKLLFLTMNSCYIYSGQLF